MTKKMAYLAKNKLEAVVGQKLVYLAQKKLEAVVDQKKWLT